MVKEIALAVLIVVSSLVVPLSVIYAGDLATMLVTPQVSAVRAHESFTVNVTVENVTDLAVWEFQLFYLRAILNCTGVIKGPFLEKNGNSQYFASSLMNDYNTTHGWLLAGSTLVGPVPGVDGSGTLATITFETLTTGDTELSLAETSLEDSSPPPRNLIFHDTIGGTVHVSGSAPNVAVTAITLAKNVVCQGFSMNISVASLNEGDSATTFSLKVYTNSNIVGTETITLNSSTLKLSVFVWTTTGFATEEYVIWAYAQPVAGETYLADNNFTDGNVRVTIKGDLVPDGVVDILDIVVIAAAFGSEPVSSNWNPIADVNNDGIVDIIDIVIVAGHFGESNL